MANLPQPRLRLLPALVPLIACIYVGLVVVLPALNIAVGAFDKGWAVFVESFSSPEMQHAIRMTLLMTSIAVPANTIFGLAAATAIARRQFRGKALLLSIIDLPSPSRRWWWA